MNPKVDAFLARADKWQAEFGELRRIIQACGLDEDFKWGQPCYSLGGKNVVLIHGFKEYCAILFMKGALLKDPAKVLVIQTDNVQASRQIRFTSLAEVIQRETVIQDYVREAAELERSGAKVEFKGTKEFAVPDEFRVVLDSRPEVKEAFEALTPGRQRAYLLHFGQAKQSATRAARVEKYLPRIMDGLGLDD